MTAVRVTERVLLTRRQCLSLAHGQRNLWKDANEGASLGALSLFHSALAPPNLCAPQAALLLLLAASIRVAKAARFCIGQLDRSGKPAPLTCCLRFWLVGVCAGVSCCCAVTASPQYAVALCSLVPCAAEAASLAFVAQLHAPPPRLVGACARAALQRSRCGKAASTGCLPQVPHAETKAATPRASPLPSSCVGRLICRAVRVLLTPRFAVRARRLQVVLLGSTARTTSACSCTRSTSKRPLAHVPRRRPRASTLSRMPSGAGCRAPCVQRAALLTLGLHRRRCWQHVADLTTQRAMTAYVSLVDQLTGHQVRNVRKRTPRLI